MMARSEEAERYRKAAHMTLDQLDWCVEYLRSIRKTKIATQVEKNRTAIARSLIRREGARAREPDEPPADTVRVTRDAHRGRGVRVGRVSRGRAAGDLRSRARYRRKPISSINGAPALSTSPVTAR